MAKYIIVPAVFLILVGWIWYLFGDKGSFAPGEAEPQRVRAEVRLGEEAAGLGVYITPWEVLEDSRCPADMQCIWAGTVRVRAMMISGLGSPTGYPAEFVLGEPLTTEAETVTLAEVRPEPRKGVEIAPSEYIFVFDIEPRLR